MVKAIRYVKDVCINTGNGMMDFIEEAFALYVAESDFVEYDTEQIDFALEQAINQELRLFVGFNSGNSYCTEGLCEDVVITDHSTVSHEEETIFLMLFDPYQSGLDYNKSELAKMFCETIRALYEDAGWNVSDTFFELFHILNRYQSIHRFGGSAKGEVFEIYY